MNFKKGVHQLIEEVKEKKLEKLDLLGLGLTHIPDEVLELNNLKYLDLRDNLLEDLPRGISQLIDLERLYLNGNQLKKIPEEILNLKYLRGLYLSNNQLRELSRGICQLKNLEVLKLNENKLKELPIEISQLSNLQALDISANQLKEFPKEIAQLKNLRVLELEKNPIEIPPPEIVNRGIYAIRNYFKELEEESDYLYEMKLLLVGEGRVGKTSLVKSLTISNYQLEDEQTTEGIDIKQWTIPKAELGLNRDFRLNIWDFGGQEIYHSTHQFFLTKRSAYLLVTESRKEDKHEDFYYWLNIIRLLGDKSPVIILQNKCDQPHRDIPILEYRSAFNEIVDFKRISCCPEPEYKHTIEALKFELKKLLKNNTLLPHIGTPLPKVWVDIRNELEELKQSGINYISRDDYVDICRGFKMYEERAIYLSEFFHDLGVFLHFNDDWELRDTVFLNHEWVTRGVYNVLDNDEIKRQQGVFNNDNLLNVWKDEKYKGKRRELLSLMRKFELCFELDEGRYLAPQLLPVDELDYEWRSNKNNLQFEYRYKFMPKGIMTRLIVRRNKYIYKRTNWKYGVLLAYKNTRAIVRERYFERKITIQLEGNNKKELLDLIRRSIRDIHDYFNNLEVKEMIPCNCNECRGSNEPYFFEFDSLKRRLNKNKKTIECDKSFNAVDISILLGEVIIHESESSNRVFISYSHKDTAWLKRVLRHLRPLERVGKVDWWSDAKIKVGDKWRAEIEQSLQTAKVAILLISADFYASDFIVENELPILLEKAEKEGTHIISLIIKPSRFRRDKKLLQFQTINDPDRPLISLTEYEQEQVLARLAETIEEY